MFYNEFGKICWIFLLFLAFGEGQVDGGRCQGDRRHTEIPSPKAKKAKKSDIFCQIHCKTQGFSALFSFFSPFWDGKKQKNPQELH